MVYIQHLRTNTRTTTIITTTTAAAVKEKSGAFKILLRFYFFLFVLKTFKYEFVGCKFVDCKRSENHFKCDTLRTYKTMIAC